MKYNYGIKWFEIEDLKKSLNIQENIIFDRDANIIIKASNGFEIEDLKKSLNIQEKI